MGKEIRLVISHLLCFVKFCFNLKGKFMAAKTLCVVSGTSRNLNSINGYREP